MGRCCSRLALVVLALGAAACDPGTRHRDAWAVWSDDQTEILVGITHWWEGPSYYMDIHPVEDHTIELRVYSPDGRYLRTLLPETEGTTSWTFFMRSAGYVLTALHGVFQRIDSETGRRTRLPAGLRLPLPSPDGSLFAGALVTGDELVECGCPTREACRGDTFRRDPVCRGVTTFVDATTFEPVGSFETWGGGEESYGMWTPGGEYYGYTESPYLDGGFESVMVSRTGVVTPVEPLPCVVDPARPAMLPQTSSHWISHDGRLVDADIDEDDRVTLRIEETDLPRWPGTCFPGF